MCNDKWQVVEISRDGWQILDNSPIWFMRYADMDELPAPKHTRNNYKTICKLKNYVNYTTEENFDLYVSWLLSNLLTDISVPILILQGTAGVGKSFTSEMLRTVLDPAKKLKIISRTKPKISDVVIDAFRTRVLVYDNFSAGSITAEISDLFATIATNAATQTRNLYSNNDVWVVNLGRSLLFNGIDDLVKRQDLLSRSLVISLEELTERKSEIAMIKQFKTDHPYILGALLNVASMALKNQGQSEFKESRFTDWGQFIENGLPALAWKQDYFKEIYLSNINKAQESLIQGNYFVLGVIELVEKSYGKVQYTATDLLEAIKNLKSIPHEYELPKGALPFANKVSDYLKRDKALLKQCGVSYTTKKTNGKTVYVFSKETLDIEPK